MNTRFDLLAEGIEGFYKRVNDGDIRITDIRYNGTGHIEFEFECVRNADSGVIGTATDDACLNFLRDYDPALADIVSEQEE